MKRILIFFLLTLISVVSNGQICDTIYLEASLDQPIGEPAEELWADIHRIIEPISFCLTGGEVSGNWKSEYHLTVSKTGKIMDVKSVTPIPFYDCETKIKDAFIQSEKWTIGKVNNRAVCYEYLLKLKIY